MITRLLGTNIDTNERQLRMNVACKSPKTVLPRKERKPTERQTRVGENIYKIKNAPNALANPVTAMAMA